MYETNYEWIKSHDSCTVKDIAKMYGIDYETSKIVSTYFTLAGIDSNYEEAYARTVKTIKNLNVNTKIDSGLICSMANLANHCTGMRKSGEQIFSISKKLYDAFDNTSINNICIDMINFPYETYYIDMMEVFEQGAGEQVKGLYVKHEGDTIRVLAAKGSVVQNNISDIQYYFMKIDLSNKETFGDVINSFLSENGAGNNIELMSTIVNLAMYINSPSSDAEVIPRTKREKRSKKKNKRIKNSMRVTRLGYRYTGQDMSVVPTNSHGGKLVRQHVVRGHWRNQPCGEGRKDFKIIFIQPYFKGPDVGETLMRKYKVG